MALYVHAQDASVAQFAEARDHQGNLIGEALLLMQRPLSETLLLHIRRPCLRTIRPYCALLRHLRFVTVTHVTIVCSQYARVHGHKVRFFERKRILSRLVYRARVLIARRQQLERFERHTSRRLSTDHWSTRHECRTCTSPWTPRVVERVHSPSAPSRRPIMATLWCVLFHRFKLSLSHTHTLSQG